MLAHVRKGAVRSFVVVTRKSRRFRPLTLRWPGALRVLARIRVASLQTSPCPCVRFNAFLSSQVFGHLNGKMHRFFPKNIFCALNLRTHKKPNFLQRLNSRVCLHSCIRMTCRRCSVHIFWANRYEFTHLYQRPTFLHVDGA